MSNSPSAPSAVDFSQGPCQNPFENPVVIDNLCSILAAPDLRHCHLLNRQWNTACVRHIIRRNLNFIIVSGAQNQRLSEFQKFLDSRDPNRIEWFAQNMKYKFKIYTGWKSWNLDGATALVRKLGPACVHSILLEVCDNNEWDADLPCLDQNFRQISGLVQGANLDELSLQIRALDVPLSRWVMDCLPLIFYAPASIRSLTLIHSDDLVAALDTGEELLELLRDAPEKIREILTELTVTVITENCVLILQEVKFLNLKHLTLVWETENISPGGPEIRAFISGSCPKLTHFNLQLRRCGSAERLSSEGREMAAQFTKTSFEFRFE